jgi:hypothetical protein
VATSELVVSDGGPAKENGSLAATFLSLSSTNKNTRLNLPSLLLHDLMEEAPAQSCIVIHTAGERVKIKLNLTCF